MWYKQQYKKETKEFNLFTCCNLDNLLQIKSMYVFLLMKKKHARKCEKYVVEPF